MRTVMMCMRIACSVVIGLVLSQFLLSSHKASAAAYDTQADIILHNIEGARQLESCPYSVRTQILPVDLNTDGTPEWISMINCYSRTYEPGWWQTTVHNEYIGHAWMALELTSDNTVADATEKYFNTRAIDISLGGPSGYLGGYGYITTKDLNGDGFPEIVYYGSRDDTRPIDAGREFNDDPLFTWNTQQSILMSNVEGTYTVSGLGDPMPAFRSVLLPSAAGQQDIFLQSYSGSHVFTLNPDGQSWSDNTAEWEAKTNWSEIRSYSNVIELEGASYMLTDDGQGISLYSLDQSGFSFLDRWASSPEYFSYKWVCFECADGFDQLTGFYWRDQLTTGMAFEDFYAVKMFKDEPPVIVAHALGFALPEHEKHQRVDSTKIYDGRYGVAQEQGHILVPPAHIYAAFRMVDGRLVPVETDILPDNIIRTGVYKTRFFDVNDDDLDDMVILTYQEPKPAVFINDGQGRFRKADPAVFPDNPLGSGDITVTSGTLFYSSQSDIGDFNGDGLLDFVFYHFGFTNAEVAPWMHETYAEDAKWNTGDIQMFFARSALDASSDILNDEQALQYELDHDLDMIKNIFDVDDDNDGIPDAEDSFPTDATEWSDIDNDRTGDNSDNCPFLFNPHQMNTDADVQGDACDDDDDNDGISDLEERALGTNPLLVDTDGDGLSDPEELQLGTSPLLADSDGDGFSDGDEVDYESNPLDRADEPAIPALNLNLINAALCAADPGRVGC